MAHASSQEGDQASAWHPSVTAVISVDQHSYPSSNHQCTVKPVSMTYTGPELSIPLAYGLHDLTLLDEEHAVVPLFALHSSDYYCWVQADRKRELEYRAGEEDANQPQDKSEKQQREAEDDKGNKQKPEGEAEAEAAQPESAEQPGPEDEEGPVNEQAGEAAKQQSFTTPEVSRTALFLRMHFLASDIWCKVHPTPWYL